MNSVECPICGNHQFKMVFTVKDHFVTHEEFPIHACIRCGMMITSSLPGQSDFGRYYKSEDYISHSDTRQGLVNKAYHAVREIMLNIKHRTIRKVSQKKNRDPARYRHRHRLLFEPHEKQWMESKWNRKR